MSNPLQEHWETLYREKDPGEVSWTQEEPTAMTTIQDLQLPPDASIIDVGGGDSKLVDHLLKEGYRKISVLDISEKALEKAKKRLSPRDKEVEWILSDILDFRPTQRFDFWHDRATFHFLTREEAIQQYVSLVTHAVKGYMLIGTFSDQGPEKCSGLPVSRYDEEGIENRFREGFTLQRTWREDHRTPQGKVQNFLFALFKKREAKRV